MLQFIVSHSLHWAKGKILNENISKLFLLGAFGRWKYPFRWFPGVPGPFKERFRNISVSLCGLQEVLRGLTVTAWGLSESLRGFRKDIRRSQWHFKGSQEIQGRFRGLRGVSWRLRRWQGSQSWVVAGAPWYFRDSKGSFKRVSGSYQGVQGDLRRYQETSEVCQEVYEAIQGTSEGSRWTSKVFRESIRVSWGFRGF